MAAELRKMGARLTERPEGLEIEQSDLHAAAAGETRIATAGAVEVTFPTFVQSMTDLGAGLRTL